MSDEVKLLPCPVPWCDGEGKADWYAVGEQDHPYWVKCKSCGCKTPSQYATVAEAIAAWNTRAIEATRPTDEVVESVKASLEDVFYDTLGCAFDADILARAAIAAMKDDAHD